MWGLVWLAAARPHHEHAHAHARRLEHHSRHPHHNHHHSVPQKPASGEEMGFWNIPAYHPQLAGSAEARRVSPASFAHRRDEANSTVEEEDWRVHENSTKWANLTQDPGPTYCGFANGPIQVQGTDCGYDGSHDDFIGLAGNFEGRACLNDQCTSLKDCVDYCDKCKGCVGFNYLPSSAPIAHHVEGRCIMVAALDEKKFKEDGGLLTYAQSNPSDWAIYLNSRSDLCAKSERVDPEGNFFGDGKKVDWETLEKDVNMAVAEGSSATKAFADSQVSKVQEIAANKWFSEMKQQLQQWKSFELPGIWSDFDDLITLTTHIEQMSDDVLRQGDAVRGRGFTVSQEIAEALTGLTSEVQRAISNAQARHADASRTVVSAAQVLEMEAGISMKGEYEVEMNADETAMGSLEHAQQRLKEAEKNGKDKLDATIEDLKSLEGTMKEEFRNDWVKEESFVSNLEAASNEHRNAEKEIANIAKGEQKELDRANKAASKVTEQQVDEMSRQVHDEIKIVAKAGSKESETVMKDAANTVKTLQKQTSDDYKALNEESKAEEEAGIDAMQELSHETAALHSGMGSSIRAINGVLGQAGVAVDDAGTSTKSQKEQMENDMYYVLHGAKDSEDKALGQVEASKNAAGRIERQLEADGEDGIKRTGQNEQADLGFHYQEQQAELHRDVSKEQKIAEAAVLANKKEYEATEKLMQKKEHAEKLLDMEGDSGNKKIASLEDAFSKTMRADERAGKDIVESVGETLPEEGEALQDDFNDVARREEQDQASQERQIIAKAVKLMNKAHQAAKEDLYYIVSSQPQNAAAEDAAHRLSGETERNAERTADLAYPLVTQVEKAETAVDEEQEGLKEEVGYMVSELAHILDEGEEAVMQWAMNEQKGQAVLAKDSQAADLAAAEQILSTTTNLLGSIHEAAASSQDHVRTKATELGAEETKLKEAMNMQGTNAESDVKTLAHEVETAKQEDAEGVTQLNLELNAAKSTTENANERFNAEVATFLTAAKQVLDNAKKRFAQQSGDSQLDGSASSAQQATRDLDKEARGAKGIEKYVADALSQAYRSSNAAEMSAKSAMGATYNGLEQEASAASKEGDVVDYELRTVGSQVKSGIVQGQNMAENTLAQAFDSESQSAQQYYEGFQQHMAHAEDQMNRDVNHASRVTNGQINRMEADSRVAVDAAQKFSSTAQSDAASLRLQVGTVEGETAKGEDGETKELQNSQGGLNGGMETDLAAAQGIADGLNAVEGAQNKAMAQDQDSWNNDVGASINAIEDGYQATRKDALVAQGESAAMKDHAAMAAKETQAALQQAQALLVAAGEDAQSKAEAYAKLVKEGKSEGDGLLAKLSDDFHANLNRGLGMVNENADEILDQARLAKAKEEQRKANQEEYAATLAKAATYEVNFGQEELDKLQTMENYIGYRTHEVDDWIERFRENDKKYNNQIYTKLVSADGQVDQEIHDAFAAMNAEHSTLEGYKSGMQQSFSEGVYTAESQEADMLDKLSAEHKSQFESITSSADLHDGDRRAMEQSMRALLARQQKQLSSGALSTEKANQQIRDRLEHFKILQEHAEKLAQGLGLGPLTKASFEGTLDRVERGLGALNKFALFGHGSSPWSLAEEHPTSLAQVGSAGSVESTRHLRSLQLEDEELAKANAELEAELSAVERQRAAHVL